MFVLRWLGQWKQVGNISHHYFVATICLICCHAGSPTNARGQMDWVAVLLAWVQQSTDWLRLNPLHQRNQQSRPKCTLTFLQCDPSVSSGIAALQFFLDVGVQCCHRLRLSAAPASLMEFDWAKLRHVAPSIRRHATATWPFVFQCRLIACKCHHPTTSCIETAPLQTLCFVRLSTALIRSRTPWTRSHPHQKIPPNIQAPPALDTAQVGQQISLVDRESRLQLW